MNIKQTIGHFCGSIAKGAKDNGGTILSIAAIVGIAATGYFAARGGIKHASTVSEAEWEEKTPVQKGINLATDFGPAIAAGIGTAVCIVGANALNKKQQATLMSAYIAGDQAFKKYRKKVDEVLGEGSDQKVQEAISNEMLECLPADRVIKVPKGCSDEEILFYLDYPVFEDGEGLWIKSTLAFVKDCAAALNRNFAIRGYAELYEYIKLLFNGENDEDLGVGVGWGFTDGIDQGWSYIDFNYYLVESTDPDTPSYYRIVMDWEPSASYFE